MSSSDFLKIAPHPYNIKWAVNICSHLELPVKARLKWLSHVIVIHDVGDTPPQFDENGLKVLKLAFNDYSMGHPQGPQAHHVAEILNSDFQFGLKSPRDLLVSCTYGQSRSAAVALGVTCLYSSMYALGGGEWLEIEPRRSLIDIYRHLEGVICPNWQLIEHFANKLGHPNPLALRAAAKHFNECD